MATGICTYMDTRSSVDPSSESKIQCTANRPSGEASASQYVDEGTGANAECEMSNSASPSENVPEYDSETHLGDNASMSRQLDVETGASTEMDQENSVGPCERVCWSDVIEDYGHMCVICYDVMARPHLVRPCGHVFCETCLRQLQAVAARKACPNRMVVFLVLCPVCRKSIDTCVLLEDLDDVINQKYPDEYASKLKILNLEAAKKRSKLPSSAKVSDRIRPRAPRANRRRRQHPAENQPPRNNEPFLNERRRLLLGKIFKSFVVVNFVLIYVPLIITSTGIVKFLRASASLVGLAPTPAVDRQLYHHVRAKRDHGKIRGLALGLFLASLKIGLSGSCGQFKVMGVASVGVSAVGLWLDGGGGLLKPILEAVRDDLVH